MKMYIAFLTCILFALQAHSMGCLQRSYAYFLGNQDVSEAFKKEVRQALIDSEVSNYDKVQIKQMNDKGSRIAGEKLQSFTALGLWFDEKSFDASVTGNCTPTEKTFSIYHEAAHYKQKHHQKLVIGCCLFAAASCAAFYKLRTSYLQNSVYKLSILDVLGAAMGTLVALPFFVKAQEKSADIFAAHTLFKIGKGYMVENYLDAIRDQLTQAPSNSGWLSNIWWPSLVQQVAYLSAVRKDYK